MYAPLSKLLRGFKLCGVIPTIRDVILRFRFSKTDAFGRYAIWKKKNEKYNAPKKLVSSLKSQPLLSVYLPKESEEIRASLNAQFYPKFEIVQNYEQAQGDYVFVAGDPIKPWALYECAKFVSENEVDFLYFDEEIDGKPYFKPDFSPETLENFPYIGNTYLVRRTLFNQEMPTLSDRNVAHLSKVLVESNRMLLSTERAQRKPNSGVFVSIIILTKDKAGMLEQCLESIYRTADLPFEIIVVNNQSEEKETFDLFERYSKRESFRVLTQNIPFNFSKLNNIAAKQAKGDVLLFLNNDTEVISSDWLSTMAGEAVRPQIGVVGAKLLYQNGTIQHAGINLLGKLEVGVHVGIGESGEKYGYTRNVSAVTGACLMIKKDLFDRIGGFDELLPVEFNDVDLCLKALKEGLRNVYIGQVVLYHYESATRKIIDDDRRLDRAIQIMADRWGDRKDPYFTVDDELNCISYLIR